MRWTTSTRKRSEVRCLKSPFLLKNELDTTATDGHLRKEEVAYLADYSDGDWGHINLGNAIWDDHRHHLTIAKLTVPSTGPAYLWS